MDEKQLNIEYAKLAAVLGDIEFNLSKLQERKEIVLKKISEINDEQTMLKKIKATKPQQNDQENQNKEV